MAVVDGSGLPIGLHVDSPHPHELTLAEPALQTISVPRKRKKPKRGCPLRAGVSYRQCISIVRFALSPSFFGVLTEF
jgi:hypothetical protein